MAFLHNLCLRLPFYLNRKFTLAVLKKELKQSGAAFAPGQSRFLYIAASSLPMHISGYTARTHELLKSLSEICDDLLILTRPGYPWDRKDSLGFPEEEKSHYDGLNYNHLRYPTRLKPVVHYALAAASVVEDYARKNSVTTIHAASNHVNALPGLIAAKRLGIHFQYEMRGLWELTRASRFPEYAESPPYMMGLALEGFVARNADKLFTISDQLKLYASRRWKIPEERIEILPNCVNIEHFQTTPEKEVCPGLIGYAGSLVCYEGLDILLQAMAILKEKGINARLRIIGDGEARSQLEELSRKLNLTDAVTFTGRMEPDKARKQIAECALICIPRNPFEVCRIVTPIKLVEAMAMGKPVIVPDLPVFRDELGNGVDELLFESGNPDNLAEHLARAIREPAKFAILGLELRKRVAQSRQWKQHIERLLPGVN